MKLSQERAKEIASPKFHPILFSTEMVRAILEGRKSQTRRILKLKHMDLTDKAMFPDVAIFPDGSGKGWIAWTPGKHMTAERTKICYPGNEGFACPYGAVGDVLWVRETWCKDSTDEKEWFFVHRAGNENYPLGSSTWKPSIHMPKSACRIFLQITDIRVERLQDISEADAIAEGIALEYLWADGVFTPVEEYEELWKKINGPDSWNENPFVWRLTFARIDKPTNF